MKFNTFNAGNYFTEERFEELCDMLEAGDAVMIYIDCIGHARSEREHSIFMEELEDKYKDKLQIINDFFQPVFKLKQN